MGRTVLVIDGHDGVGKTTLSMRLAQMLGGVHVRPFAGPQGALLLNAAERGNVDITSRLACSLVDRALSAHRDASIIVCDRQWMTAFTLLPKIYWDRWQPLPPTTLCWIDVDTTLLRLAQRQREIQYDRSYHTDYVRRYWDLGQISGCHVLRTDQLSVETCLKRLVEWARPFVEETMQEE